MVRAGGYFRNIVSESVRMGPGMVIMITLEIYYLEVIRKRRVLLFISGSLFAQLLMVQEHGFVLHRQT